MLSEHRTESVPAPEGLIRLTVNGQVYQVKVEPEWTLYDLIHDKMGLTGTKMFCDRGTCGSCTVIMDGRAILSCMTLAIECGGKSVETVEEVARTNPLLIEKYAEHHAMQCGYCTPGFVVCGQGPARQKPEPDRGRDQGGPGRQPVPLRHLSSASQGDPGGCREIVTGEVRRDGR